MAVSEDFMAFARIALFNANRYALQDGKFFPIPEAVQLIVREGGDVPSLIGARIYFEPPVESIYWLPTNAPAATTYNTDARKLQAPPDCTFYIFSVEDGVLNETPTVYAPTP